MHSGACGPLDGALSFWEAGPFRGVSGSSQNHSEMVAGKSAVSLFFGKKGARAATICV